MKTHKKRTKHNKSKKRIPNRHCENYSRSGLQTSFQHSVTHFGWAVLAKSKEIHDKVVSYKKSLDRLDCSLDHALQNVHDPDSRHDIQSLKVNLKPLIKAARQIL